MDVRLLEDNERTAVHPQTDCTIRRTRSKSEYGAFPAAIREADRADVGLLTEILRRSFHDVAERFALTVENCPKHPAFCTDERVEADFERGMQFYVLEHNGAACGCVALERPQPELCYLGRLGVLPQCRGRGFGRALATRAFYEAWELGVQRIEIGMIAEDVGLAEWYAALGFVRNGTRQLDGHPFEVGFMVKRL